ncbi:hypothetical protein J1N35_007349 [Gossypium stocksii]|uniref:Uncharacterized protein n=1 Tax=Gossypium stocksii TaxID=47602 RepID=A0A9D4AFI0_9ROSI|nr:hypothetical protein J1N35_007349 [Gossypium stocksii]
MPIHKEEEVPKEVNKSTEEEKTEQHEPIEEVAEPVFDPVMSKSSSTTIPFPMRVEDKKKGTR